MKRNKSRADRKTAENLSRLAEIEGVSRATATRWNRAGYIVWNDDDGIDVAATKGLLREFASPSTVKDPKIAAARLQILEAEAKIRQLRLRQREGELLEAEDAERAMLNSFGGVRGAVTSIVPFLYDGILLIDRADRRAAMHAIAERVDMAIFSTYVVFVRAFAELSGKSGRRAEKMVADAWRGSFGALWEEALEKIEREGKSDL